MDERKSATTRRDVEKLAQKYGMDLSKLESVSRFVSSPSVVAGTGVSTADNDGEEHVSVAAVWVDPQLRS